MLRVDWEKVYDPKDVSLWNSIEDIVMEYPYPEQERQALRLLDKYFRTNAGGSHNPERAWNQKKIILKNTMDELQEALQHKEVRDVDEWNETQTRDESLETKLQREEDQRESSMKKKYTLSDVTIRSYRKNFLNVSKADLDIGNSQVDDTAVQDNKAFTDETGDGGVNKTKNTNEDVMKLIQALEHTQDPGERARLENQINALESQASFISFRHADAVQDYINYTDKFKNKDFSNYARQLKGPKKKKKKKKGGKKKKKSNFVPEKDTRNPIKTGPEQAGPEWQARVERYMSQRKKRKATLKEILHVESKLRNRTV